MIPLSLSRRATPALGLALLALAAPLGACAGPAPSSSRATAAERAACRTHADEVFSRQNRDAIYRSDTYSTALRDSPFASSGMPGLTTTGLSQQYGVENTMQDCLRGIGNAPAATEAAPPGTPPIADSFSTGGAAPATVK